MEALKVNFYANFRNVVGGKTVTVDVPAGSTVHQLVQVLVEQYPVLSAHLLDETGALYSHVHVFVNGRDAPYLPEAMHTVLSAEDKVDIFPPVAGGSEAISILCNE